MRAAVELLYETEEIAAAAVDLAEPLELFEKISGQSLPFLLDSALVSDRLGRYSILGCDPFLILRSKDGKVDQVSNGRTSRWIGDPFDALRRCLKNCSVRPTVGERIDLPFFGGAVGYLGYDLNRLIEHLPDMAIDDLRLPDYHLAFYDKAVVHDHLTGETWLICVCPKGLRGLNSDLSPKDKLERFIRAFDKPPVEVDEAPIGSPAKLRSNFTRESYEQAVGLAKEYIRRGDIFQVNLSQRFEYRLPFSPLSLFRRLRLVNPAPFSAYMDLGEFQIVSASPERFLRVVDGRVETRPIKGTRPRTGDPVKDREFASELLASEKDRAEHVMIVDVERNDLGRVCDAGTVEVSELMALEEYATVHHLVSTIEGRLRPGRDTVDLLKAAWPGGSITGAPKIRAMEIIEELEPVRRGVYTGSVAYLSFDGSMDSSIVIRTFIVKNGVAYFNVGGGIVADSDPAMEYLETLDKARGLLNALDLSEVRL